MKKVFAFWLLLVVAFNNIYAQTSSKADSVFNFKQLDNRQGLSNSAINAIFEDSEELLWIGTWDGLNSYNGTNFDVYNHSISRLVNSVGSNVIHDIAEDKSGNIWINTVGGISRYEKSTGKFYRYFYKSSQLNVTAEKEFEIAINGVGEVFCYGTDGWLKKYDANTDKFINLKRVRSEGQIIKMAFSNGLLWCLFGNGKLNAYNLSAKNFLLQAQFKRENKITNFFTINGLVIYSVLDKHFAIDKSLRSKDLNLEKAKIKSITYYLSNYIIAWDSHGASAYDQKFKPSNLLKNELKKLENFKITSLATGKNQILWIGTDGNGIIQVFPKIGQFKALVKFKGKPIANPVRAFLNVDGNLWVGTKGDGILIYDRFWAGNLPKNQHQLDIKNGLPNNSVFTIKSGTDGLVFIGTDGEGLTIYDKKNKKIHPWATIEGTSTFPKFKSVYAIVQDKDSVVWVGTSGYGLLQLKFKKDLGKIKLIYFKQYKSSTKSTNGLAGDIIYDLALGKQNQLWIACRYSGLTLFDYKQNQFRTFKATGEVDGLSHSDAISLFYDKKQRLWIGTSFGLNCLEASEVGKPSSKFKNITTDDGLLNNTIHAIEGDEYGNIWLSTNKGLAKLNPEKGTLSNYLESDGLQSNEFSDGAAYKSDGDMLFFGGIYGANFFDPKKINGRLAQPNIFIYDLQFGGNVPQNKRFLVISSKPKQVQEFQIERKNNFFQFSFNALNYFNTSKNEVAYKLSKLDRTWRLSGANGKIAYYNIPPGKYNLLVKWSNGEGAWTQEIVALRIEVKQYFWLTKPAYLVYFLLLLASAYTFHRYRKNKLEMSFKLERETLFRQKDEEIHKQRVNFFTNIAHELQTPLTLILGSVEHLIEKQKIVLNKENSLLATVRQHTARLTYLVQQLLEFRKAEAGFVTRNDSYLDVSKMLNSLSGLFSTAAERNGQQYQVKIQQHINCYIDKDKYEKILFNLLSNAIKYAPKKEVILLEVSYNEATNELRTVVANSGTTLKQDDLDRLFTQFHMATENRVDKFGTGIGLAFTNELVGILRGNIKAYLLNGWVYFDFVLPVNLKSENNTEEVSNSAPSYLLDTILTSHQPEISSDIAENNKVALIKDVEESERDSILIVEDDQSLRHLLKSVLKENYIIYEADNGNSAISFLKNNKPNVIISDVMMPEMDGLAFCRYVKSVPALAGIPFILLTARGSEENKVEGYEIGADAYIPKPFHINYLKVRIKKLIDYKRKTEELIKDANINEQFVNVEMDQSDKEFLNALVRVVEENLAEPDLDAAKLQDMLSISKMQLYRKLKSLSGMTPSEFIKRIRLKKAAMLLRNSKLTVSEIFYLTGFNNKSYFFREFKKIYHLAPNEYRELQHQSEAGE
ncbi:hybrid sensor histidine kinase/response regulator [Pedobacter sp.]